jgi:endonuclease YncB( thermonuclease family)
MCAALAALALLGAAPAGARPRAAAKPQGSALLLDGTRRPVRWIDGDTFRVLDGPQKGRSARVLGVNSLESYGPVHRWGRWRPAQLLGIAKEATRRVRVGEWHCQARGGDDAYGRMLVSCPDAAAALVRTGLAMVFAVGEPPDQGLLALQRKAQARGAGMWRKGVPPLIPSSVHSADEPGLEKGAYDRIVDTRTGVTEARPHDEVYQVCQEVCVGQGADRACMTWVPFERRYKDRPPCLFRR